MLHSAISVLAPYKKINKTKPKKCEHVRISAREEHHMDNQRPEYDYTQIPLWCLHSLCLVYCSKRSFVLYWSLHWYFSSPFTGYHFHKNLFLSLSHLLFVKVFTEPCHLWAACRKQPRHFSQSVNLQSNTSRLPISLRRWGLHIKPHLAQCRKPSTL